MLAHFFGRQAPNVGWPTTTAETSSSAVVVVSDPTSDDCVTSTSFRFVRLFSHPPPCSPSPLVAHLRALFMLLLHPVMLPLATPACVFVYFFYSCASFFFLFFLLFFLLCLFFLLLFCLLSLCLFHVACLFSFSFLWRVSFALPFKYLLHA